MYGWLDIPHFLNEFLYRNRTWATMMKETPGLVLLVISRDTSRVKLQRPKHYIHFEALKAMDSAPKSFTTSLVYVGSRRYTRVTIQFNCL